MAFGLVALWQNGLKLNKQSVSILGGILMLDCQFKFDLTQNECFQVLKFVLHINAQAHVWSWITINELLGLHEDATQAMAWALLGLQGNYLVLA